MHLWLRYLFTITLFFPIISFACGDVRLDLDPNVLGKVPVWQQGELSACPAYAATQLVDAYRFSNGDKDINHLTSPLALAVGSINVFGLGGHIQDSLDYAGSFGSCDAKSVSDFVGSAKGVEFVKSLDTIYSEGQGLSDALKRVPPLGRSNSAGKQLYQSDNAIDDLSFEVMSNFNFAALPLERKNTKPQTKKQTKARALTSEEREAVDKTYCYLRGIGIAESILPTKAAIEGWIIEKRKTFVKNVTEHLCTKIKKTKLPPSQIEDFWTTGSRTPPSDEQRISGLKSSIEKQLRQKNPVGINFCNEVVTNPNHKASYTERGWTCSKDGDHAAVIVGSKSFMGQCRYLVRDSYCSEYPKKSQKGSTLRIGTLAPGQICEKGQYWISEESLLKNTQSIVHY